MTNQTPIRRCAIYTRKSSEEGLDQAFNSLDAQREACAAYVASQRQEGWRVLSTAYDDGGYSGGTLERPALKRLLADIRAGQIDLVVVYKIDRLTRSLTDFASLVAVFESHAASFVSVTQHFNTTTSMGRLTLNVLLSFAQFERELTGERIRDKIAASKRKGMWMGGTVPLGYRSVNKKLMVVSEEADQVRRIFERYCQLGSVAKLQAALRAAGEVSKTRVSRTGRQSGGQPFSRGALYLLLQNRVYRGEIPHRDRFYAGEHEAIVSEALWEAAQSRLAANREAKHLGKHSRLVSLLAGLVRDDSGRALTPSHTVKKGKRYRYYIARPTQENPRTGLSVPAYDLEQLVTQDFCALLCSEDLDRQLSGGADDNRSSSHTPHQAGQHLAQRWASLAHFEKRSWLLTAIHHVIVDREAITIALNGSALRTAFVKGLPDAMRLQHGSHRTALPSPSLSRRLPARLQRCGSEIRIIGGTARRESNLPAHHITLLNAIARARSWYEQIASGSVSSMAALARAEGLADRYVSRLLRCALLNPNIVEALLGGDAPIDLTLAKVLSHMPHEWDSQGQAFGFSTQDS
jgi:DNA invertase Pin-like site-specific DNA recombinase